MNQEQILKALSGLIPENAQKDVTDAVTQFLDEARVELEQEFNGKLEDGYKQAHDKVLQTEQEAEKGYSQALEYITELRNRLELQKEEFEQALEEGYEEAYQMLQEERAKNDTLEVDLYEEYEKRLNDVKEFMVDKVDTFLSLQGEKYFEMAKKEAINDPTVVEHKVAFDRILEVASNYLSDEDFAFATGSKVDALQKQLDEQKGALRILEAKNMRLATDNNKLNESLRHSQEVINESVVRQEKKARVERAGKAQGRGQTEPSRQVVIGEWQNAGESVKVDDKNEGDRFVESIGEDVVNDWKHLSGLVKNDE